MRLPVVTLLLSTSAAAFAAESKPDPAALLAAHTRPFAYTAEGLSGPGADFLRSRTAGSQFVLLGESHMDHATPVFAGGLFAFLHDTHGFRHLVVEQDPVAMEDTLAPERRGDADKLAAHAKRHPTLFEFDSDEDLAFLAQVGRRVAGPDAIWGVEQTTGAARYLEELAALAPNAAAKAKAEELLAAANAADPGPKYSVNWLANLGTPARLEELAAAFAAPADSRTGRLIAGLLKSAEVFGYYTRANAGEYVGLYNNTVREEVLKANFLRRYHAAARDGALPKALFKFGSNHLYRGRNPTQAYPIGNLAHEFAIVNGHDACGLYVMPLGPGYASYKDFPAWLQPFLPPVEPTEPVIVDLRPLRPYQRLFREGLDPKHVEDYRTFVNGYDALVLLPGSKPATKLLGGRSGY